MTELVRLLVLDDDPMQLELVERALARDGFEVRTVATVAALPAEAARFEPHVVLVDVNLPDAEPEQAIRIARDAARGAPVVLYSAWDDARLRALALRSGADGYLSKSESVLAIGPRLRAVRAGGPTRRGPR